ncbi:MULTISPECIES: hypothetical protein [Gordonia]|uniref:Uncharacterized protein n=1 Tax=Gordonia terrae C-6 TaxID=1316928 RepID=R7Y4Z3_9ACTN|nr:MULTISPECIES: hypothetical protein [Gordonia]EON31128.1 hypothetical protein GTC6_19386 [Gordonia terrae C-6]
MSVPQLVGRTGTVTMAIPGGEPLGEVELPFAGGTERFLARAAGPIGLDEAVLVIAEWPGRIVDVEPWARTPGPEPR